MKPQTTVNKILAELGRIYHPSIPLDKIFSAIENSGGLVIDESGKRWQGFICGESGRDTFQVSGIKGINTLYLSWYKMQSGRFEIVSYIS